MRTKKASHALIQRRKEHAGSVPRVSAAEVEALVCEALRRENSAGEGSSEKDLLAERVARVIVQRDRIEVEVRTEQDLLDGSSGKLAIPFAPIMTLQKGITRRPASNGQIDAVAREKLLNAIRRAYRWVEALRSGEAESFDEIAAQEGLGE